MGQGANYHMFSKKPCRERGNIMVYILIAIALFGGLTLVLSRQNKQSESQSISDEQLAIQVKDLLTYAATAAHVVAQMQIAGAEYNDIVFFLPSDTANFGTNARNNIYHPSGGGLIPVAIDKRIFTGTAANPPAGWYIGRFNNVEGTPTTAQEIMLAAHQISKPLCAAINKKLAGDATIPALGANPAFYLVPGSFHNLGNGTLTKAACPTCYDKTAYCVRNTADTAWTFYSILAVQ